MKDELKQRRNKSVKNNTGPKYTNFIFGIRTPLLILCGSKSSKEKSALSLQKS